MATKKANTKKDTPEIIEESTDEKVRFHSLCIDGEKYKTLFTTKYKNRKVWEKPNPKKIYSDIPGTIIKVYVTEGQKVNAGELMLVLEAMKMKNKLVFPINGTVKKIYVKENEKVPKQHLMIELK